LYTLLQHSLRPFASSLHGQFATELGGQFLRNIQTEADLTDDQRANIDKMAQIYITSHANILWKKDVNLMCIAVGYDSMEKMTDINTLEKLTKKA
jgi:hypothetical protein